MNAQFDENTLSAYVDGELDADVLPAVEAFIEADPDARRYVLDAVGVNARLRAELNPVAHEPVPDRLYAALQGRPRAAGPSGRTPVLRNFLRVAAAAVLLLAGFGVGKVLQNGSVNGLSALGTSLPAAYQQVVDRALEHNLSGTVHQWQPPEDETLVKVTPVKTYRSPDGRYYREYVLEIDAGKQKTQVKGLAYRTGKQQWKTKALFF
jgi:surface antigen